MRPRAGRWLLTVVLLAGVPVGLASALYREPPKAADGPPHPNEVKLTVPPDSTDPLDPFPMPPELVGVELMKQTDAEKEAKSRGCLCCHTNSHDPHAKETVRLGCTDCHGGDATTNDIRQAHVAPSQPGAWPSAGNPARTYALLNHERPEFVRFVNPGDLRVAHISCGTSGCHPKEVYTNRKQLMATGCMLWGAALYNNGAVPYKQARHGEAYSMTGAPLRVNSVPPPTKWETEKRGIAPFLDPLPHFEVSQPGNLLRIFEAGGRFKASDVGLPETKDESGRTRVRLSERGLGTGNRTDPVLVSLNKTRLFDPTLWFLGTNDHPGDYRSSGCTACHVVYANDRSPVHSGPYHVHGNRGTTASDNPDPTINKNEPGHPIAHKFTSAVPTSQCMVCHMHPGTTVMNSYPGYMWWDQETEGHLMYPAKEKNPTAEQLTKHAMLNPDETAARGNWGDPAFLHDITQLNPHLTKTQFADFHGHGWVYRAVFNKDKTGKLTDYFNKPLEKEVTAKVLADAVAFPVQAKEFHKTDHGDTTKAAKAQADFDQCRAGNAVHMLDIHMEKGMHCVDCHFVQDMHGNGRLHTEVRAGTEIACIDCHGTAKQYTTLRTSGAASYTSTTDPAKPGRNLAAMKTPFGKPRFEVDDLGDGKKRFFQNSMVEQGVRWEVVQTRDTVTKGHPRYNAKSDLAKTVRVENGQMVFGNQPSGGDQCLAHSNGNMSCIACHSGWNPSCYGCHLPQRANAKMPHLHFDGDVTRNYTPYNFQTLRDDVYMLARDGDATGNKINPSRSSCAIHVGSYNGNRESVYVQQQTISAEGFSGVAFSTNVPHTVRGKGGTKMCSDCHVSAANDNNAWLAQLTMQGTGTLNLIGRYAWVAAGEEGLHAVTVTEREEPQAVVGSSLHATAFPQRFEKHCEHKGILKGYEHPGYDIGDKIKRPGKAGADILSVQNRGEYLLAACGEGGVRMFDIAFIDNKGFSERILTAPVSPLGQKFHVETKFATAVAAPTTMAPDPTRKHRPENKEGSVHPLYAYVYVADKFEGLILVQIATMIDGNPLNNFLKRELTFNPDGLLCGATNVTIVGTCAYVTCDAGLVVVNLDDPKKPCVTAVVGGPHIHKPKAVQVQFRYAYVVDEEGVKVLDATDLARPVPVSMLRIPDCHNIYLARTYAYLAAGPRGLLILDISKPTHPSIDQQFTGDGCLTDTRDVKLGITYVSQFAYVADGKNGMRVVQLTGPDTPGNDGFSPRPTPRLVATYPIPKGGKALAVARGLDRDRAADESGNQLSVFGRVGARPFTFAEVRKLFQRDGRVWDVTDDPADGGRYKYLGR